MALATLLAPWIGLIGAAVIVLVLQRPVRENQLRRKGLDLLLAGHPVEAEACFRASLALSRKLPESQVRSLVCLADCLLDQDRNDEARILLDQALTLGDDIGSAHGSLADLLLHDKSDPRKVIDMAEEALHLGIVQANDRFPVEIGNHCAKLLQVACWSRKAEASAQLGDRQEAREEAERALRVLETMQPHFNAETLIRLYEMMAHWHIALALLALGDKNMAADHFRLARDLDPKGKYRILAQRRLAQLGYSS